MLNINFVTLGRSVPQIINCEIEKSVIISFLISVPKLV